MSIDFDRKLAFVANGKSGFVIIDITDPSLPSFLSNFNAFDEGYWCGIQNLVITSNGKYACAAYACSGLGIIDITDPFCRTFITL